MQRRQRIKEEANAAKDKALAAQTRRRDRRKALREVNRISGLQEVIVHAIESAPKTEYETRMRVYDVRDSRREEHGAFVIGGFVGELILFFQCVKQTLSLQQKEETFPIVSEYIQAFLAEIMNDDYPEDILVLETDKEIEPEEDQEPD